MSFLLFCVFVAVFLVAIELVYFHIAKSKNIMDRPNERSSHTEPTLLGGGILFPIAVVLYFVLRQTDLADCAPLSCAPVGINTSSFEYFFVPFLIAAVVLAVVSYVDDVRGGISPLFRLAVQVFAVAAVVLPFLMSGLCPVWLFVVLLAFGIVMLNSFNFLDGINGMLSLYSVVVVLSFVALLLCCGTPIDSSFLIVLLLSLLIFLFFNFRRHAVFFSGDVGSITLGLTFFFLLVFSFLTSHDGVNAFSTVVFVAVFLVDAVMTVLKRLVAGKNILQPHREHLYEILTNDLHLPHLRIAGVYAALQAVISVGFFFASCKWLYAVCCFAILCIAYIASCRMVKHYMRRMG